MVDRMHKIPNDLKRKLSQGKVIPFVGAGISARVRRKHDLSQLFPGWDEFLKKSADRLRTEFNKDTDADLIDSLVQLKRAPSQQHEYFLLAAEEAKKQLGPSWYELLQETFGHYQTAATPESLAVHRQIWSISNNLVVTTNFDHSLQWPALESPHVWNIVASAEQGQFVSSSSLQGPTLWYLHGNVSDKANTILTNSDFQRLYAEETRFAVARRTLEFISQHYTVVFFGCSLRDVYALKTLKTTEAIFSSSTPQHYAVVGPGHIDERDANPVHLIKTKDFESDYLELMDILVSARQGRTSLKKLHYDGNVSSDIGNELQAIALDPNSETPQCSLDAFYHESVLPELQSTGRTISTIDEMSRALKRWQKWEATLPSHQRKEAGGVNCVPISEIAEQHLLSFQKWLALDGHSPSRINTTIAAISRMLMTALRLSLVPKVPRIPRLATNKAVRSDKYILSVDEVQRLWDATVVLKWPDRNEQLERAEWNAPDFWRAAIVFWLTYGLKTQDLISTERAYNAITWENIKATKRDDLRFDLVYSPQHNQRRRPTTIQVPLTPHAITALSRIRPSTANAKQRVFHSPFSSVGFRDTLKTLAKQADLEAIGGVIPTVFRNTCGHFLERHYLGISRHVLGLSESYVRNPRLLNKSGKSVTVKAAMLECFADFDPFPFVFETSKQSVKRHEK